MLVQTILNKVLALGATLVLAYLLDPAEIGVGNLAVYLGAFAFVLSPYALCEVLVTMKSSLHRVAGVAVLLGGIAAIVMCVGLTTASGAIERLFDKPGLAVLLCFVAWRPIADAVLFLPFARMRADLRFREQAKIDAIVILCATLASVVLAYLGAGAIAIIVPPIAALALRGMLYTVATGWTPLPVDASMVRPMARIYSVAGLGQYLGNVIAALDVVVVGWFASESGIGLFALAFQLATQANSVLATQVALVLQPIFVRITDDPARQVAAFMRATRLLCAVCVPISIMQAALAPAGFALLFESKWSGSVPIVVALSLAQAFLFAMMPAAALMKAQGRFTVFCVWQFAQLVGAVSAYAFAAHYGQDAAASVLRACGMASDPNSVAPFAIAAASAMVWALFLPVAVWIAGRPAHLAASSVLRLFLAPWLVCVPLAAALIASAHGLHTIASATTANILTLLVLGPLALALAIIGCAREHPDTWTDFRRFTDRLRRKSADAK